MSNAKGNWRNAILVPVFLPAVIVIALLVIGTLSAPELAGNLFSATLAGITEHFGWFYMLAVALFLIFIVGVALSRWGRIKLGPDHCEPEYSFTSWFAMLFSAGYGIALLFFGVAEPVLHFAEPPVGAAETVDAAKQAMQIAYFHWGFHIWAIYGLVGLVLAYFSFRHGLPLSMRSTLYPLIGDRIHGPAGHTIDTFAILSTLFGIATTLGLSVIQINTGLNYLWEDIPVDTTVQVIAIAVITLAAIASVVAGMDKGIKRLSLLNMTLVMFLLIFVFAVGPTVHILETYLQNTGAYLSGIVERTFNLQAYTRSDWIGNWTLFIFGWTIAWAPFVGLFIAKISRGRTIRQFVLGVMLVPTFFTFFWFAVFGDTALNMIMNEGYTSLIAEVQNNQAIALFKLFENLPLTNVLSFATVLLIITFFVTSSDSGSLVVDSLASGGVGETPVWQRVFWASIEGLIAAVLLVAGGLNALQTAAITSALPFSIIILIAAVGMWRALVIEGHQYSSLKSHRQSHRRGVNEGPDYWKKRLRGLVKFPQQNEVKEFIYGRASEALEKVKSELQSQDWPAQFTKDEEHDRIMLTVEREGDLDFAYEIRLREYSMPQFVLRPSHVNESYYRAELFLRQGGQSYDLYGYEMTDIINDVINQFENYLHFRHHSPGVLPWEMEKHDEDLQDIETNK
ncbi:choline/glycine/proline betaine transport protein [Idiomarina fontislapidosi]|uniref:Choline transporter n=1 Tax=Idiomarina fontislapidosi TaxID=263723 RepID=A0A432Y7R0_9GAMM|nr:BCCT family transporter [Idiomarina fontislapidosi]PYE32314.1 choline/glycine/proline betaine transport protein [Idiomarina fontislapidosi]RUO57019.1 choline transporter [Idiomarina fontislapidosi]|tara:strand:+ start:1346 stop:3385 length:2040 start_codon:yes stop_codon:yes gene_type:complete